MIYIYINSFIMHAIPICALNFSSHKYYFYSLVIVSSCDCFFSLVIVSISNFSFNMLLFSLLSMLFLYYFFFSPGPSSPTNSDGLVEIAAHLGGKFVMRCNAENRQHVKCSTRMLRGENFIALDMVIVLDMDHSFPLHYFLKILYNFLTQKVFLYCVELYYSLNTLPLIWLYKVSALFLGPKSLRNEIRNCEQNFLVLFWI